MLGKAFSITVVILCLYIIGSIIFGSGTSNDSSSSPLPYHLGCYEADTALNTSKQIEQYLIQLQTKLAPYEVSEVRRMQSEVQQMRVNTGGANAVAMEFKKYIIAYENIKSLNQYEKSYNNGLKQAKDDFLGCRDRFLKKDWDCKGAYQRYQNSEQQFNQIRGNLSLLIDSKFQEQSKIEKLLQPPKNVSDSDSENYHKLIIDLNKELSKLQVSVKEKNQTLVGLENKEFRLSYDLNAIRQQLEECHKNKNEVEMCKHLTLQITLMFEEIKTQDLQGKINTKRAIIGKYNEALAKCNKVGQDGSDIRQKIAQNQQELNILLQMNSQTEIAGLCASDLIKKCSDEHIKELEENVTSILEGLNSIALFKKELKSTIEAGMKAIDFIHEQKRNATEEFQNSIGSLEKLRQVQRQKLQKLKIYRDNISNINTKITAVQSDINLAEQNRRQTMGALDVVLGRVGDLTECLAKKEYLIKLQGKKPKSKELDARLKLQAGQTLIKVIRSVYK